MNDSITTGLPVLASMVIGGCSSNSGRSSSIRVANESPFDLADEAAGVIVVEAPDRLAAWATLAGGRS